MYYPVQLAALLYVKHLAIGTAHPNNNVPVVFPVNFKYVFFLSGMLEQVLDQLLPGSCFHALIVMCVMRNVQIRPPAWFMLLYEFVSSHEVVLWIYCLQKFAVRGRESPAMPQGMMDYQVVDLLFRLVIEFFICCSCICECSSTARALGGQLMCPKYRKSCSSQNQRGRDHSRTRVDTLSCLL
jgi:hypothetical protein